MADRPFDVGGFINRAIDPYKKAYKGMDELFKEYIPGYDVAGALERKVYERIAKNKRLLPENIVTGTIYDLFEDDEKEETDEADIAYDDEFGVLERPSEVFTPEPPSLEDRPSELDEFFEEQRKIKEGKGISDFEEWLLPSGPGAKDFDDPGERKLAKINELINRSLKVGTFGTAKGGAAVPQLAQLFYKYGIGSVEQGLRGIGVWDGGMVDYDELLFANTLWKDFSDGSEAYVKDIQEAYGLGNLNTAESMLMMTADFMVPLKIPFRQAASMNMAIKTSRVVYNMTKQYGMGLKLSDEFIDAQVNLQKGILPPKLARSEIEAARLDPLKEELKQARTQKDVKRSLKIQKDINATKENILKEGLSNLKGPQGRGFPKLRKTGDNWWDYELRFAQPTRGEYITGAKRTGKTNPWTGLPQYENVHLVKGISAQELASKKHYNKLLEGQAIVSAGAVAGTWHSYFQDTELQDLAYGAGLVGAFMTPSATMRLIDYIGSTVFGPAQKAVEGVATPFKYLGIPMPGGLDESFRPTIGSIIYLGGYALNSTRRFFDVTGKGVGIDPKNYADSNVAKRARLTAMGVPLYKVFAIDGKRKLKDNAGRETPFTDLDVYVAYSQKERKALDKLADLIASGEVPLPDNYMKSINSAYLRIKKIAEDAEFATVTKGEPGAITKESEFIFTTEQIVGAMVLAHGQQSLRYLMKDDLLRKNIFGFGKEDAGRLLTILRSSEKELDAQLDLVTRMLTDMASSREFQSKAYQQLKEKGMDLVADLRHQSDEFKMMVQEVADKKHSIFNIEKNVNLRNKLLDSEPFALRESFGLPDTDPDITGLAKLRFVDDGLKKPVNEAYELQRVNKDDYFEIGIKDIEDDLLDATAFMKALQDMRSKTIQEMDPIMGVMKDTNRVKAFGGVTLRDPNSKLDFSTNIDDLLAYARYNGFVKIVNKQDGSSTLESYTLKEMENKAESVIESFKGAEADLALHNNTIPTTPDPSTGYFDLAHTVRNLDETQYHAQYFEKLGLKSSFANDDAMKLEYLKQLLANLKPRYSGNFQGTDYNPRSILSDLFDERLTAGDMHRIRSNMSSQGFKRKADPVYFNFKTIGKALDETFETHSITEIADANKIFTDWKFKWEESYAGQELLRSYANKGMDIRSLPDEKMLEVFLKAENSEVAGKLFKELFDDFTDFTTKTSIDMSQNRNTLKASMDVSFGKWLHDSNAKLGISDDVEGTLRIQKVNDLYNNGLISKQALDDAVDIIEDVAQMGIDKGTAKLEASIKKINRLLNNVDNAQQEAIKTATGEDFAKITDSNALYDFIFPKNMADTFGKEAVIPEKRVGDMFEELRKRTLEAREEGQRAFSNEAPDYTQSQVEEMFRTQEPRITSDITGTRLEVVVRQLTGLTKRDIINGNINEAQSIIAKDLRDSLVWTMIRNSVQGINKRAASTWGAEAANTARGLILGKRATLNENFDLSRDLDVVGLVKAFQDMAPHLDEVNSVIGKNFPDEKNHVDKLRAIMETVVAVRADIPKLEDISSSIPSALTQSAAQAKVFAGMRGVVSWRYLATDQVVREYQRSKALLFHTLYTNPGFIKHLDSLVQGKRLSEAASKEFMGIVAKIMIPRGLGRIAIYNKDEDKMDYDPPANIVTEYMSALIRQELPVIDMSTWELFAKPKAIQSRLNRNSMKKSVEEQDEEMKKNLDIFMSPGEVPAAPPPTDEEMQRNLDIFMSDMGQSGGENVS